jgi:hypothetical protein
MTGVLICCFIVALAVQHDDLPLLSLSLGVRDIFFVILAKLRSVRYLNCLLSARFLPLANAPRDCHPPLHD